MSESKVKLPELSLRVLRESKESADKKSLSSGLADLKAKSRARLQGEKSHHSKTESNKDHLIAKYLAPDLGSLSTFITLNEVPVLESRVQMAKTKKYSERTLK